MNKLANHGFVVGISQQALGRWIRENEMRWMELLLETVVGALGDLPFHTVTVSLPGGASRILFWCEVESDNRAVVHKVGAGRNIDAVDSAVSVSGGKEA